MKILVLLSLSLAVTLAMPPPLPPVPPNPGLTIENRRPLLGDLVPAQGHVVVEVPAPQLVEVPKGKVENKVEEQQENEVHKDVKVEAEVKELEPQVKEPEVKVIPEAKELQVKVEPEVKEDPEVKVEPEVEEDPEVKVEPEVEEDLEVMVDPEFEEDLEVMVDPVLEKDLEVKVEPEVKENLKAMVQPQVKEDLEVMVERELQEPELKVDPEVNKDQNVIVESEIKEETEEDVDPEEDLEVMVDPKRQEPEVKVDPEVNKEQNVIVQSEVKEEPEVDVDPEEVLKVMVDPKLQEPEVMVDPEVNKEQNVIVESEVKEEPVEDVDPEVKEEPEVQSEPLEFPMFNEFQYQDAGEPIEGGGIYTENMFEPIMEPLDSGYMMPDGGDDPEPSLMKGDEPLPEEWEGLLTKTNFQEVKEAKEDWAQQEELYSNVRETRDLARSRGWSHCNGVVLDGKCYQFFSEPKKASDAEFFCQKNFFGGHLASITSLNTHTQLKNLILRQHGRPTRTWIGGLRYLNTGLFIWLDGAQWTYADWLWGEPNNTSDLEDCLEILGDGKFNDFTCWEPQTFICSFPFQ